MSAGRVLVVEDEVIVAFVAEETLTRAGFEVCGVVASEQGALDIAARSQPTHALVDIRLAPGDGRVVARELRDRYGTAIVFATAYREQACRAIDLPNALCLGKPYEMEAMILALHAARRLADGTTVDDLPWGVTRVGDV